MVLKANEDVQYWALLDDPASVNSDRSTDLYVSSPLDPPEQFVRPTVAYLHSSNISLAEGKNQSEKPEPRYELATLAAVPAVSKASIKRVLL